MFHSLPSRWMIFLVSGALTALGCVGTTDTGPQSETGSLSVDLVLADGLVIDEVSWQITGNGMDMSGDIDASAPGSTASVEVFGLPPGETDYTVTLTATTTDEAVSCQGSAPFNVEVGQSTDVMVMLNCKKPRTLGGVRVNGKFNICTQLTKTVVSPLQTSVGNDISLAAQAFDEEGDAISYSWTGTGGSIADPTAPSTTYTCQDVGDHTVTIRVTDNDMFCNMATWTVPVTCVEGDGGDLCEDVMCTDDGNECTATECNPANGECETSNVEDGTECDGGTCSGGVCVAVDLCDGVDCNDDNECTADACDPADGSCSNNNVDNGTPCAEDTGMCVDGSCMVADLCDGVVCDDTGNECTVAMCNTTTGLCETMNVTDGTECNGGAGACSAGVCIDNNLCDGVNCTSQNDCVQDGNCDPATGTCIAGDDQPIDTACTSNGGSVCDGAGACVACNAASQCPDDGNACTAAACESNACVQNNVMDGQACDFDGSAGICEAGTCVAAPECVSPGDCIDGNPCTMGACPDGMCVFTPVDGGACEVSAGVPGTCSGGGCVGLCVGEDCTSGSQCVMDGTCDDQTGECIPGDNEPADTACTEGGGSVCDGAGNCVECNDDLDCSAGETCNGGACEAPALATCDPTGQGAVVPCTTPELVALDCFLLGSGAPIPLDPVITPDAVAVAGVPLDVTPIVTLNLPASLVCGFATVVPSAIVFNSLANLDVAGATPTSIALNSFLGDPPASPHGGVPFDFKVGCGNQAGACSGGFCNGGTTACNTDNDCLETGPGVVVPLVAGSPTSSPGTETLTPSAAGAITFSYGFDDIGAVINVPALFANLCIGQIAEDNGPPTPPGGSCGFVCVAADRTGDGDTSDPNDAPRVMYDAQCDKAGALAGDCEPFFDFSGAANVCATGQPGSALAETEAPCNGEDSTSLRGEDCAGGVSCGDCQQVTGPAPLSVFSPQQDWPIVEFCSSVPGNGDGRCAGTNGFIRCPNGDSDCRNPDGSGIGAGGEDYCIVPCATCDQQDCCDWIQSRYPNATPAQFPALPVNPAP